MRAGRVVLVLAVAGLGVLAWSSLRSPPATTPDANAALLGLRAGPGRDAVAGHCLPCHSAAIIAANHLPRAGWDAIITQMQQKNGMPAIAPAVRARILDYLEAVQRPDDVALTAGKQSPWAAPLYRPNPLWQ